MKLHVKPISLLLRENSSILPPLNGATLARLYCSVHDSLNVRLAYYVFRVLEQEVGKHFYTRLLLVTIYISPLLSLGSDQVNKLMRKTRTDNTTTVPVHLDEVKNLLNELNAILSLIKNADDTTCVIIFPPPQSITEKYPHLVEDLKSLIRFGVVDEWHLFNSFGRSFRKNEFNLLKQKLFTRPKLNNLVPMLFLTATCTHRTKIIT